MDVLIPDTHSSSIDTEGLSKEEVETLSQIMSWLDAPATASSFCAHTGNLAIGIHASATPFDDPWVIDSGAFDHMTGMSALFSS